MNDVVLQRSKWTRRIRKGVCLISAVAVWAYWYTHPNGKTQFERVFGQPPPQGVSDIVANRPLAYAFHMDTVVLLRFVADEQTVQKIAALKNLEADPNRAADFYDPTRGHARLWQSAFTTFAEFGDSGWRVPNLIDPVLFEGRARDSITQWKLLWDRSTKCAWVLYTIG